MSACDDRMSLDKFAELFYFTNWLVYSSSIDILVKAGF